LKKVIVAKSSDIPAVTGGTEENHKIAGVPAEIRT
jgi:hypothetical protein